MTHIFAIDFHESFNYYDLNNARFETSETKTEYFENLSVKTTRAAIEGNSPGLFHRKKLFCNTSKSSGLNQNFNYKV